MGFREEILAYLYPGYYYDITTTEVWNYFVVGMMFGCGLTFGGWWLYKWYLARQDALAAEAAAAEAARAAEHAKIQALEEKLEEAQRRLALREQQELQALRTNSVSTAVQTSST